MGRASRQAGPLARRALIACLATPTAALDTLWQAPAARAELKVADSAEARPTERRDTHAAATTTLRCSGSDPLDRACLAHDLYYDTQTRTFLFYGSAIVRDVDEDAAPADAESFRQATAYIDAARDKDEFELAWSGDAPPDAQDTCTIELPVHLRREMPLGTGSYGHMLRDNIYHLVVIPKRFGMSAASFAWVTWPRSRGHRARSKIQLLQRLSPLLSVHTARRWHELENGCRNGGNELGPDPATKRPRYLRLRQALLSGSSDRHWTDAAGACKGADFAQMRDHAHALNGIVAPQRAPSDRVRLAVVLKATSDRRQLIVPPAVVRAVREKFPQVDVELHTAAQEDEGAQLSWLARTDILVSNLGSASFRMMLLPDGAQMILVGALETPHTDEEGNTARVGRVWRELDQCWDAVPNFTVHRYHVRDAADIVFKPLRGARSRGRPQLAAEVRIRDSDVIVRPQPFLEAVEAALAQLDKDRRSWARHAT